METTTRERARVQAWRDKNRERWLAGAAAARYGITVDEALELRARPCALAGLGTCAGRMAIDHDHATGRIRGALCGRHNRWIADVEHDPAALTRVAEYLGA